MEFSMNRKLVILFLLVLLCHPVFAQVVETPVDSLQTFVQQEELNTPRTHQDSIEFGLILPDVIPAVADTVAKEDVSDPGYSAKNLKMQPRYVAGDVTAFSTKNFLSNTFAGVSFDYFIPFTDDITWGPVATFHVGKFFSRSSGLRLDLDLGMMRGNYNGLRYPIISGTADYVLNFSSFANGFDKYRLCEFSGLVGVGFMSIRKLGKFYTSPAVKAGLNINFHIFKAIDLFIEPKVEVYGHKGTGAVYDENWRKYDVAMNLAFGLAFRSVDKLKWEDDPGINWYAFASAGPQWQNSAIVSALGIGRNLGFGSSLGVGFHFLKWLDFQVGGYFGRTGWNIHSKTMERLNTNYAAARFTGLFDIVNMITKRDDTLFSGGIIFGPEIGGICKYTEDKPIKFWYFGMTAGAQVKYRVTRNVKVFVEPKFNLVPYAARSDDPTYKGQQKLYYDGLINCSIGVEYHFKRKK